MNVIDEQKLAATLATALADAQARGVVLEDQEAAILTGAIHAALAEASTDAADLMKTLAQALLPAVEVVSNLQMTLNMALREAFAWRQMFERIDLSPSHLSPPETPGSN
ncbi:MAG: hypothetical protein ABSD56_00625 [Bryobacteraceae bacterium]|jgi:urease gamma subunit